MKVKEIPKQNQYWLKKDEKGRELWIWFKHFVMPGGIGEERFFFVIAHQKFYSPPQPYPPIIWYVGVFLFWFGLFDDEVEKVVIIMRTLHASLEQHYISVLCGPSWEGWAKRRWLQFLAV